MTILGRYIRPIPIPPITPNNNHMIAIFADHIDAATAAALIILPIIPIGRQPNLLQRAEATGAIRK